MVRLLRDDKHDLAGGGILHVADGGRQARAIIF
jgi:hypothetical protein